jgi:hypothetical protein
VTERFHLALTGVGGVAVVLVVTLALPALRGDPLAIMLEAIGVIALMVVVLAELAAPRKLLIDVEAICVRNAFGIHCVRRDSVKDVRIQRMPFWRGGDRILVLANGRILALPFSDDVLQRLRPHWLGKTGEAS